MSDKWAVSMEISGAEAIERRLEWVLHAAQNICSCEQWLVSYIDATGTLGNTFTERLNKETGLQISTSALIELAKEVGQVVELSAVSIGPDRAVQVFIRDGVTLDVIASGLELLRALPGPYHHVDPVLFA